jgi:hypothetical protein
MKNISKLIISAALFVALAAPQAWAIGMGLNSLDAPSFIPPTRTLNFSSAFDRLVYNLAGKDLIIDTAVAKNRLFNYRLNISIDTFTVYQDRFFRNVSYTVNRLTWANTFGFGLWRSRYVRLWAGPQIALSYQFSNRADRVLDTYMYSKIGPVIGANFHTGEFTTVSVELGFRTGLGYNLNKSMYDTISLSRPEPMAAIKLIFRAWDIFVPSRG